MKPQQPKAAPTNNQNSLDGKVGWILLKYLRSHRHMEGLPTPAVEYGTAESDDTWTFREAYDAINKTIMEARQQLLSELPDRIKTSPPGAVLGVAIPRQEMDKISLQDLRLVLDYLKGMDNA